MARYIKKINTLILLHCSCGITYDKDGSIKTTLTKGLYTYACPNCKIINYYGSKELTIKL